MSLFNTGEIQITPAAQAALDTVGARLEDYLARHRSGDWGDLDNRHWRDHQTDNIDWHVQLESFYDLGKGVRLHISTAADRSYTRVALEEEFEERVVDVRSGYAAWSRSYDKGRNALIATEEPRVDQIVAGLTFSRALDVGAGTGRHTFKLVTRAGVKVTALDITPEMQAIAQERAAAEGIDIDFRLGDVMDGLPFADAQFDFLICALTLSHLPELATPLTEFARVLEPGGHALLTDFHPAIQQATGWAANFQVPGATINIGTIMFARQEYLDALDAAGFEVLEVQDVPMSQIPPGYMAQHIIEKYAEIPLCLIILARKS